MLARVMLAGVPVSAEATAELAGIVRAAGGDELADRLERALRRRGEAARPHDRRAGDHPGRLEDPPDGLCELRGVLMNEHQWRQREGLDP